MDLEQFMEICRHGIAELQGAQKTTEQVIKLLNHEGPGEVPKASLRTIVTEFDKAMDSQNRVFDAVIARIKEAASQLPEGSEARGIGERAVSLISDIKGIDDKAKGSREAFLAASEACGKAESALLQGLTLMEFDPGGQKPN